MNEVSVRRSATIVVAAELPNAVGGSRRRPQTPRSLLKK
jgi:hypothetical protein